MKYQAVVSDQCDIDTVAAHIEQIERVSEVHVSLGNASIYFSTDSPDAAALASGLLGVVVVRDTETTERV